VAKLELFGTPGCPYTLEMREALEWDRREFVEYNVESDAEARRRMRALANTRTVPVLVEDGKVLEIGWRGHGCMVEMD
jgi:glutaredoxin